MNNSGSGGVSGFPDELELKVQDGADRDISRLPARSLEDLAEDPFPPGVLKMQKYKIRYRVRFGNEAYRIVYEVNEIQRLVNIVRVRPRPTAYRRMGNV